MYKAIEDYKSLASGANWDDIHSAGINDDDPVSNAFLEGYTKSPVSIF